TLSLQAAATRRWDVAVVGAGPAGALAAYEMATRGYSVLLIDKAAFPRGKVCGSCLNGQALAALHGAGLGTLTQSLGAVPLHRFWLASRGQRAVLQLPSGVAISRDSLDAALVLAAIHAGANFLPEALAVCSNVTAAGRNLR